MFLSRSQKHTRIQRDSLGGWHGNSPHCDGSVQSPPVVQVLPCSILLGMETDSCFGGWILAKGVVVWFEADQMLGCQAVWSELAHSCHFSEQQMMKKNL